MHIAKTHIPWIMAATRGALGPILLAATAVRWNPLALAGLVLAALLSDIFDGVLARRWRCDTPAVRLFDTLADTVFYLFTGAALHRAQPAIWRDNGPLLVAVLSLEVIHLIFDLAKFGKPASYHSYLAKTWGLVLATAVISTFALGRPTLIVAALLLGVACKVEGLAMSMVLPVWRHDVKTLGAALRLRALTQGSLPHAPRRVNRAARLHRAVALALALLLVTPAFAVTEGQAAYIGGTTALPAGTLGALDSTGPKDLVFRAGVGRPGGGASGTATEIHIPYESITSFHYSNDVARHIGVVADIAVSLVKRRERKHFFTITYAGTAGVAEVAIFEVAKHDPPTMLAILRGRSPQACGKMPIGACGGVLKQ